MDQYKAGYGDLKGIDVSSREIQRILQIKDKRPESPDILNYPIESLKTVIAHYIL